MPIGEPKQPIVTYDGRILLKPVERDEQGRIIPDPSWSKMLRDHMRGESPTCPPKTP